MKIVDVCEFYAERGGGVKTYIDQKLAAGRRHGIEIAIVAPGAQSREEDRNGGRIIWVASPRTPDPRYHIFASQRAIHAVLDREAPDIVEGSSPWLGGQAAGRWTGAAAKVFYMHQDPVCAYPHALLGRYLPSERIDRLFAWFWVYLKRLARRFDATIVGSEWLAGRAEGFGMPRPLAIPLGVDKAHFLGREPDAALKAELLAQCGLPPDATLLLAVSRMHPEKRLDLVIKAFDAVSSTLGAGLVIIGDGPIRDLVKRQALRCKHIHVAGFIADRDRLARIMASADALVHGGAYEPFGLAVAEALCAGLPLVLPSTGGAAEIGKRSCTEYYEANDIQGCSDAIKRLLARGPRQLRLASRQAAVEHILTPEEHFERLFGYYRGLSQSIRHTRMVRTAVESLEPSLQPN